MSSSPLPGCHRHADRPLLSRSNKKFKLIRLCAPWTLVYMIPS